VTSGVFRIWQKGGHGERAEREPIRGVWGGASSGVQGQSAWSGGQGAKPSWSWNTFCFWTFNGSRKFAHFYEICWKTAKNAPFDIKSPVKNFRGRAKGVNRTMPPWIRYCRWQPEFLDISDCRHALRVIVHTCDQHRSRTIKTNTPCLSKKRATFIFWIAPWNISRFW